MLERELTATDPFFIFGVSVFFLTIIGFCAANAILFSKPKDYDKKQANS